MWRWKFFVSNIKKFPSAPIFASDLSKIAVKAAKKRLSQYIPKTKKKNFLYVMQQM